MRVTSCQTSAVGRTTTSMSHMVDNALLWAWRCGLQYRLSMVIHIAPLCNATDRVEYPNNLRLAKSNCSFHSRGAQQLPGCMNSSNVW